MVRSTHGSTAPGRVRGRCTSGRHHHLGDPADRLSDGRPRPSRSTSPGLPARAAFSWYTYSPTRVRYPYARGLLVEMYREAKARLGDPVLAWADIQADPERRRRYQRARGKGRTGAGEAGPRPRR